MGKSPLGDLGAIKKKEAFETASFLFKKRGVKTKNSK